MSPIHVRARKGEVAERVLLPGDPGRAEWIATTFLEEPRLYTSYRGLLGFTGRYRGVPVSVQTTGMGAPSASIVAEELVGLGARVLLRVGTCGAVDEGLSPGDLVIVQGAVPLDGTTRQYLQGRAYAPVPDAELFRALWKRTEHRGYPYHVGLVATEDAFYATTLEGAKAWAQLGVLAFEMEASALFLLGKMRKVRAGAILTVSNRIGDPELAPPSVHVKTWDHPFRMDLRPR
ncbi:purine-nucleoside phosphorylase, partial [Thermus neutrinimicus]|uniref:phosphorylase family protein n=1 Tax=Thermus neutrinimicus TaxID=2908149 RepID=UPI001FAA06E6